MPRAIPGCGTTPHASYVNAAGKLRALKSRYDKREIWRKMRVYCQNDGAVRPTEIGGMAQKWRPKLPSEPLISVRQGFINVRHPKRIT